MSAARRTGLRSRRTVDGCSWPSTATTVVVVQGTRELTMFDPDSHRVVRSIEVGRQPHWVAAAAGAGTLFVTNEGSNDLSIIDIGTGAVRSVAVGRAPRKVVVQQQA